MIKSSLARRVPVIKALLLLPFLLINNVPVVHCQDTIPSPSNVTTESNLGIGLILLLVTLGLGLVVVILFCCCLGCDTTHPCLSSCLNDRSVIPSNMRDDSQPNSRSPSSSSSSNGVTRASPSRHYHVAQQQRSSPGDIEMVPHQQVIPRLQSTDSFDSVDGDNLEE